MTTPLDDFVGELRLGKGLTSVVQIVALALNIGLGLILFYSSIILSQAQNNPILSVLAAVVTLGLTLLNLIELIGGSGEWGGTYQIVYEILHRSLSFLTGWGILLASLALGSGLALLAADQIHEIFQLQIPVSWTALGLLVVLLIIQLFQFLPRRIQGWIFAGILSVIVVVSVLTQEEFVPIQFSAQRTAASQSAALFLASAALICGAYAIFEVILSVRRQVRNPTQLLPRSIVYTYLLWFGLVILAFFEFGRQAQTLPPGEPFLISLVTSYTILPDFVGILLILLLLLIGSNSLLMLAARQISGLVRTGGLPTWLREVKRPFPLPIFMFIAIGLILIPLTLAGSSQSLAALAGALFIFAMIILNFAAIRSHRSEPNRRRTLTIPFSPLFPGIAIAMNIILFSNLPTSTQLVAAAWIGVGVVVYFTYARSRLLEVKLESSTFGRMAEMDENEAYYRILVPIGPGTERHFVLNTAITLARQAKGEVLPLQVVTLSDPLAIEEGRRTARERNTLFSWSVREAKNRGVPVFPITRLSRSVYDGILETAEEERVNLILIPWAMRERFQGMRIGQSISQVVRRSACDVAVLAYHAESLNESGNGSPDESGGTGGRHKDDPDGVPESESFQRIYVPTSGGPNAPLAVQIAVMLALETEAHVSAVYITTTGATEEELTTGQRRIEGSIEKMIEIAEKLDGEGKLSGYQDVAIEGKVIQADSIVAGIAETAGERDLILLGVSEESVIDQVLFGTIPERVAAESAAPVMLVKRYRGLPRMWFNRLIQSVFRSLPKLNVEEQIEVYRNIHRGSRPSIDYFIMIGLSAMIATFGLFLNSTAVIIGAMLVAPLFSPIIGLGLSTSLGNVRLLRLAIEATLKGIALAIAIAAVVTILSISEGLTPEILSRTQPSLLDLAIALASGAAGAYAMARKDVATALPGVAIAAALVPPLCVVGIGVSFGDPQVTFGSLLLFLTNLVSIVLAGSVVFLLLGFRPGGQNVREHHFQRALLVTVSLFILILIPLGFFFVQSAVQTQFRNQIESVIIEEIEDFEGIQQTPWQEIIINTSGDEILVSIPILAADPEIDGFVSSLSEELSNSFEEPVVVRALVIPIVESP